MATLSQTSLQLRKVILGFLIFAGVLLLIDTASKFLNSPANPFITVGSFYLAPSGFSGVTLPEPVIASKAIAESSNPSFVTEGVFATFPDTALVYKVERPTQKLNTVENAVQTSTTLGFIGNGTEATQGILTWQNSSGTRNLSFNIVDHIWSMTTQYFQDVDALQAKTMDASISTYESAGRRLVTTLGFSSESMQSPNVIAKFAKLGTNGLFTNPANSAQADYVVIDVQRNLTISMIKPTSQLTEVQKQIKDKPTNLTANVYKEDPRRGSLHVVVSNKAQDFAKDVYEMSFTDFEYTSSYGVYSILTPSEAWNEILLGNGSLVLLKEQTADYFADSQVLEVSRFRATATETELAYFEPNTWEGYVYPIYIFRGRAELVSGKTADFVFYVDAIRR